MDARRFAGAADAYDHHVGRYGAQLAAGLLEVARIRRGQRVLDVGSGPGPLTRALADRVGAVNVAAVDPSPDFVEACRARVPYADVRVATAEELPFSSHAFDAALAVAPDRAGAIDDGRRVGYERPDDLEALWQAHGLLDVTTGQLWVTADYDGFDDLFQPFTAGTGHSGACYASLDRAGRERVRAEAHHRLGEPHGAFTLRARAWWVRGLVPCGLT